MINSTENYTPIQVFQNIYNIYDTDCNIPSVLSKNNFSNTLIFLALMIMMYVGKCLVILFERFRIRLALYL